MSVRKKKYEFFTPPLRPDVINEKKVTLYIPAVFCAGTLLSLCTSFEDYCYHDIGDRLLEYFLAFCIIYIGTEFLSFWQRRPIHKRRPRCRLDSAPEREPCAVEASSSTESVMSCSSLPELSKHRTCAVQTEGRNFKRASQAVKQKYDSEVRKINRDIRLIRRKFAEKFKKLKTEIKTQDKELAELQLKIPLIENQRDVLHAEKDAVDKQIEEENKRYEFIQKKFENLNLQISQLGSNAAFYGLPEYAVVLADNCNNSACVCDASAYLNDGEVSSFYDDAESKSVRYLTVRQEDVPCEPTLPLQLCLRTTATLSVQEKC